MRYFIVIGLAVQVVLGIARAGEPAPTRQTLSRDEIRARVRGSFLPRCGFEPDPERDAWEAPVRNPDNHAVVRELLREILESYEQRSDIEQNGALWLLAEIGAEPGSFSSLLVPLLSSSNPNTRWGAARALGATGTGEDAPLLIPLLDDQGGDVAYQALLALAKIGTVRELPALRAWHDRVGGQGAGVAEGRRHLDDLMTRAYQDAIGQIEARAAAATRPSTMPAARPAAPNP